MVLGFSRDVGAAERERGVNRPSLRCIRSWCCSMLLSVKRVSSLLPEAKQSIPRREVEVTVQHVTSHCISRCILLPCGAPGWIRRRKSKSAADGSGDQVQLERAERGYAGSLSTSGSSFLAWACGRWPSGASCAPTLKISGLPKRRNGMGKTYMRSIKI